MVKSPRFPRTKKELRELGIDYGIYRSLMMENRGYDVVDEEEIEFYEIDNDVVMEIPMAGSPKVKLTQSLSGRTLDIIVEGSGDSEKGTFVSTHLPLDVEMPKGKKGFKIQKVEDAILVYMPIKS